jgi:acetylornithine deacetylase
VWSEVEITGRAAHGSRPHLGVDAIVKAGPVLTALGRLDRDLHAHRHPLLDRPSVHASVITGGEELSSYPGRCVVGIERRTLPGESVADVEDELERLLDACRADDADLVVARRTLLAREPFEVAHDAPVVAHLGDAIADTLGARPAINGASYWAESAFIAAAGIPTVLYGPSGEGAHALEEWVSLSDTEAVTRVLVDVARRICA